MSSSYDFSKRNKFSPSQNNEKKEIGSQQESFVDNRESNDQISHLQSSVDNSSNTQEITQLQEKVDNNTGMPDDLKQGVEGLSGQDMSDVKVTYNSDKPAQLQAHAYAQGNNIYIAPGQEKYLPHEAWHVVQQKQDRVQPTTQLKGNVNVNDDTGLEKEADVMGDKAASLVLRKSKNKEDALQLKSSIDGVVQLEKNTNITPPDAKKEGEKKGDSTVMSGAKALHGVNTMVDGFTGEGNSKGGNTLLSDNRDNSNNILTSQQDDVLEWMQEAEQFTGAFQGVIGLFELVSTGWNDPKFKNFEDLSKFLGNVESVAKGVHKGGEFLNSVIKDDESEQIVSMNESNFPITELFGTIKSIIGVLKGFIDFLQHITELMDEIVKTEHTDKKRKLSAQLTQDLAKMAQDGSEASHKILILIDDLGPHSEALPVVGSAINIFKNSITIINEAISIKQENDTLKNLSEDLKTTEKDWKAFTDKKENSYKNLDINSLAEVKRVIAANEANTKKHGEKASLAEVNAEDKKSATLLPKPLEKMLRDYMIQLELRKVLEKRRFDSGFKIATSGLKVVGNALKLAPDPNVILAGAVVSAAGAVGDMGKAGIEKGRQVARDAAAKEGTLRGKAARKLRADKTQSTDAQREWKVEQTNNILQTGKDIGDSFCAIKNKKSKDLKAENPKIRPGQVEIISRGEAAKESKPEIKKYNTMLSAVHISDTTAEELSKKSPNDAKLEMSNKIYKGLKE